MAAERAWRAQPPLVFSQGVGFGQPEKVLFSELENLGKHSHVA